MRGTSLGFYTYKRGKGRAESRPLGRRGSYVPGFKIHVSNSGHKVSRRGGWGGDPASGKLAAAAVVLERPIQSRASVLPTHNSVIPRGDIQLL